MEINYDTQYSKSRDLTESTLKGIISLGKDHAI